MGKGGVEKGHCDCDSSDSCLLRKIPSVKAQGASCPTLGKAPDPTESGGWRQQDACATLHAPS